MIFEHGVVDVGYVAVVKDAQEFVRRAHVIVKRIAGRSDALAIERADARANIHAALARLQSLNDALEAADQVRPNGGPPERV